MNCWAARTGNMTHIFAAKDRAEDVNGVMTSVIRALESGDWISTGMLYVFDSKLRRTNSEALHAVLKELLSERAIRMRVVRTAGRDKTEFRLVQPNAGDERTQKAPA